MMILKALEIKREHPYRNPPEGKLIGEVEFANAQGLVKFTLTEEDAIEILKLCAKKVQERVIESSKAMYLSLDEHTKLIESHITEA